MGIKKKFFLFFFIFFFLFFLQNLKENSFLELKNSYYYNINYFFQNLLIPEKKNISKIIVETDLLRIFINLNGGNIEKIQLLKYKDHLNSKNFLTIFKKDKNFSYFTQNIIKNFQNSTRDLNLEKLIFITKKIKFKFDKNQSVLIVPLKFYSKYGFIYTKEFIFKKGEYYIKVNHNIKNNTNEILKLDLYNELKQTLINKQDSVLKNIFLKTIKSVSYSSNYKYSKYDFNKFLKQDDINITTNTGWVSMLQKYFLSVWIPNSDGIKNIYVKKEKNLILIGYISKKLIIPNHSVNQVSSFLWVGPKISNKMILLAKNLDLTSEYGWFFNISKPLFNFLKMTYKVTGNWGFSIIIITCFIRLLLYPLTKSQYISLLKIKNLQPEIELIKKKYAKNKNKMSEKLFLLYKNNNINPFSGFITIFIQMPIFLSLYYMLNSALELRHAPFIFWIKDLSDRDPIYILPILMGLSMWLIQKNSCNNISDPFQIKIMNIIPLLFIFIFLYFPSGLVLYYIINNLITMIQQYWILFFVI